jgi:DNA processing protein
MAASPEAAALVALLRLSPQQLPCPPADLVQQVGSARAALERVLDPPQGQLLASPNSIEDRLQRARDDLVRWEREGLRVVTVLDPEYPANLQRVHDRPPLLFIAGQLVPGDERAVAVIGSRRASAEGLHLGGVISNHLGTLEYTVVSGLADGIDTAAHTAVLQTGRRTVAVVGTGLRHVYPAQNAPLHRRIARTAAVISPFWPESEPSPDRFRRRNVVMSGVSLATVIVEAGPTSGTRVQARAALAHGRPVFLLRRMLVQSWAHELAARPNVFVVDDPVQITSRLDELIRPAPLSG